MKLRLAREVALLPLVLGLLVAFLVLFHVSFVGILLMVLSQLPEFLHHFASDILF